MCRTRDIISGWGICGDGLEPAGWSGYFVFERIKVSIYEKSDCRMPVVIGRGGVYGTGA